MSWKSIIVHVKADEDWAEATSVAIRLAKPFEAKLTGLMTPMSAPSCYLTLVPPAAIS
jgi:hypothetical protein